MNITVLSGVLGLVLALGLWLVLAAMKAVGAPNFADRIAPQLRAAELTAGLGDNPWRSRRSRGQSLTGAAGNAVMHWILQRTAPLFSNADVLARRLVRDGSRKDVMDYRAEQVLFGVAGAVVGSVIGTALVLRADVNIAILAVGAVLGAGTGVWLRNYLLSRSIQRREKRMLAEFPSLAELMAELTAGLDDLHLVSVRSHLGAPVLPGDDVELRGGETLVLSGKADALARAEQLLAG